MRKFGLDNYQGTSLDYGIRFLEFPIFKYGEENIKNVEIPGKQGTLSIHTRTYSDTIITNVLEFESSSLAEYNVKLQGIKDWLYKTKKVKYTDAEDFFYIVKEVEISEIKRIYGYFGNIKVLFRCDPMAYFECGCYEKSLSESFFNPGIFSQPIYQISGEGMCTITVNGKEMTANISDNLTIDTELMIAYREDRTLTNTAVSGNYEDLYLQEGENTITVTDGFECKVIPRWRCL